MKVFSMERGRRPGGDFAGLVPASRGAHCRPLHPRLASLCCRQRATGVSPGACRRAGTDRARHPKQPAREPAIPDVESLYPTYYNN
jgi:hypothetical protein